MVLKALMFVEGGVSVTRGRHAH